MKLLSDPRHYTFFALALLTMGLWNYASQGDVAPRAAAPTYFGEQFAADQAALKSRPAEEAPVAF